MCMYVWMLYGKHNDLMNLYVYNVNIGDQKKAQMYLKSMHA
jgi:hypothetical protein